MKPLGWIGLVVLVLGLASLLAHYDREQLSVVSPGINQEALARKAGITRVQASHVLNKLKKLGYIDYEQVAFTINSSLLSVVLND